MTTEAQTEVAPAAETKEKRVTMRSILIGALLNGETDNTKLVGLVKAVFPDEADKRILTSLAVHRSFLKKEAATALAAKLAPAAA